jgi:hypothetical protein
MPDLSWLKTTLAAPKLKNELIPHKAQWLSGEGAGSWFYIEELSSKEYEITRFSATGITECKSIFECVSDTSFHINQPFQFVHLSHCKEVRITQNNKNYLFVRKERII